MTATELRQLCAQHSYSRRDGRTRFPVFADDQYTGESPTCAVGNVYVPHGLVLFHMVRKNGGAQCGGRLMALTEKIGGA